MDCVDLGPASAWWLYDCTGNPEPCVLGDTCEGVFASWGWARLCEVWHVPATFLPLE